MKRKLHNEKGFTLIELMATLAILALIVLIAVPAIGSIISNADDSAEANSIAMIERAGALADVGGLEHDDLDRERYTLESLISAGYLDLDKTSDTVFDGAYVQKVGTGNTYEYNAPSEPTDAEMFTFSRSVQSYTITGFSDERPDDLTDIVIPDEYDGRPVTLISRNAFSGENLTSVEIPNTVVTMGANSFYNNDISYVKLSENVESIPNSAFESNNLEHVVVPEGVIKIGNDAFADNLLETVLLPNSLTDIWHGSFEYNNLKSVVFPPNLESIRREAFNGVSNDRVDGNRIAEIILPEGFKSLSTDAFVGNNTEYMVLPSTFNTDTFIGDLSDVGLSEVVISHGIDRIPSGMFARNQLTDVEIPGSVKSIGGWAFQNNNLESVLIGDGVESLGQDVFEGNAQLHSLYIPASVKAVESNWAPISTDGPNRYNDLTVYIEIGSDMIPVIQSRGYNVEVIDGSDIW